MSRGVTCGEKPAKEVPISAVPLSIFQLNDLVLRSSTELFTINLTDLSLLSPAVYSEKTLVDPYNTICPLQNSSGKKLAAS